MTPHPNFRFSHFAQNEIQPSPVSRGIFTEALAPIIIKTLITHAIFFRLIFYGKVGVSGIISTKSALLPSIGWRNMPSP